MILSKQKVKIDIPGMPANDAGKNENLCRLTNEIFEALIDFSGLKKRAALVKKAEEIFFSGLNPALLDKCLKFDISFSFNSSVPAANPLRLYYFSRFEDKKKFAEKVKKTALLFKSEEAKKFLRLSEIFSEPGWEFIFGFELAKKDAPVFKFYVLKPARIKNSAFAGKCKKTAEKLKIKIPAEIPSAAEGFRIKAKNGRFQMALAGQIKPPPAGRGFPTPFLNAKTGRFFEPFFPDLKKNVWRRAKKIIYKNYDLFAPKKSAFKEIKRALAGAGGKRVWDEICFLRDVAKLFGFDFYPLALEIDVTDSLKPKIDVSLSFR